MSTAPPDVPPPVPRPQRGSGWRVVLGLGLLSAIPVTAGVLRLAQLAGGPDLMPHDPRFDSFPVAIVVHIVASAVFAIIGAGQFLPQLRRRGWHRNAGRVLAATGLLVAGTALWLTLFYEAKPGTGVLLFAFRLAFASAMGAALVLGFTAIRRGDVAAHRAWMVRAYAIGLGAGTQVLTEGFGEAIFESGVMAGDLEKIAGWAINLGVAEWAIRRRVRLPALAVTPA
jgi:uncharacterized membrane protein YozB (DUF420 family)